MKNGIELLRDLSFGLPASTSDSQVPLPQGKLRFLLEYKKAPDLETETNRLKSLLQSEGFELFSLPGDADTSPDNNPTKSDVTTSDKSPDASQSINYDEFGEFYVLQFPALERTLSQRSLFDIAYALEAELGLISSEPDLESRVYADPQPSDPQSDARTEGVIKDAFTDRCWVDKQAPANKRWAIDTMRIPQAWALSSGRGAGVLIAQPDTGIAAHNELDGAKLRLDLATNLVDSNDDPTDPLHDAATNPGHGTGTASVIISTGAGVITGASPGAELIPIRCVEDVKIFDAAPVISAINHARAVGSHVITMSLGGIPSRAMKKAIRRAVNNNIIVIAAAGNCVDLVVWPARYRDVIAVGGCNIDDQPWRGSSYGHDIDISAPAELVWVARRKPNDQHLSFTEAAQGTSFATALTASTAALWISHHGHANLMDAAKNAGVNLQQLFNRALSATARKPVGWSTDRYGAGIINAERLLELQPTAIMNKSLEVPSLRPLLTPADVLLASVENNTATQIDNDTPDNSLRRFEREIGATLLESARLGNTSGQSHALETATTSIGLSQTLQAILANSTDSVLEPLKNVRNCPPAARVSQALTSTGVSSLARLALKHGQRLESATTHTVSVTRAAITPSVIQQQVDALELRINASPLCSDSTKASRQKLKDEVLGDTEKVLNQVKNGDVLNQHDVRATTALEALVKMTGRPAIKLDDQPININDPNLQEWVGVMAMLQDALPTASQSVGRIDAEGIHQGTGFVVGPGIVLTNRHVVEGFAAPLPSARKPDRWLLERDATINFSPNADDPDRQYRIQDVLFTGPDPISGDPLINHDELDMALLAVETTNTSDRRLPVALNINTIRVKAGLNKKCFLLGYPAAPGSFPKDENGLYRADVVQRIRQLFGMDYGICYLSPGLVVTPVDSFELGNRPISFSHDATSLGGSSGSCLLSCDNALDVMGLHYGGDWLKENFAHDLAYVSSTLIKIPQLINQIDQSVIKDSTAFTKAAVGSKINPAIDLSAVATVDTGKLT